MVVKTQSKTQEGEIEYGSKVLIDKPKASIEHLILFLLIFGFIFTLKCFWSIESILWNRIVYSTGSQWQNSQPIYFSNPLEELQLLLTRNFVGLIFGVIAMFIACLLLMNQMTKHPNYLGNGGKYRLFDHGAFFPVALIL